MFEKRLSSLEMLNVESASFESNAESEQRI